jgi:superfamily I DNA/RNA helicase
MQSPKVSENKLTIAAAGSGKTTFLVEEALKIKDKRVLITTYTQANEGEIRKKLYEKNKCIPNNVTVQTWFSFLLQHGVRPFQGCLFDRHITGLILVNNQSAQYIAETNIEKHYFTSNLKIYSDKISKFVFKCNEKSRGAVIDRLSRIYPYIFIDEVQDLAGYDLELLKLIFNCNSSSLLVGDPRQGTYSTNSSTKNRQFKKAGIVHFFEDTTINITTDSTSLNVNYRCNSSICDLSNKLFPTHTATTSGNNHQTGHDGIFLIKKLDVSDYLKKYSPMQLRDSAKTETDPNYRSMNMGESKGLSFDRVLIYPTKPILDWLANNDSELAPTSRSKLYVALTRARYSVGIICDYKDDLNVQGITKYCNQELVK